MYITVQFRNREDQFAGKTYDFELCAGTPAPPVGSIIRMIDKDEKPVCNRTRVKVIDAKKESSYPQPQTVKYQMSSMEEESIAKKR